MNHPRILTPSPSTRKHRFETKPNATVLTGYQFNNNLLHIREELDLDHSLLENIHGPVVAEPGSIIRFFGSAELDAPAEFAPLVGVPNSVDNVYFGPPSTIGNTFRNGTGLVFTEPSSTLRGMEPSGNYLDLIVRSGNLEIHSRIHEEASEWNADEVRLQLGPFADPVQVEATSPDFGGIWFTDSPCIKHWGETVFLDAPFLTELVDEIENARSSVNADTGLSEAMYAGHIFVETGAAVGLNDFHLYYASITGDPCPGPTAADPSDCFTQAVTTLYGDYDGDEVADDAGDAARFLAAYPSMDANGEYDALADWDCDGVISYVEHQKFLSNWPGASGLGDECTENGPCLDRDVCSFGCCMEGDNVCSFQEVLYGDVQGGDNICGQTGPTCGPDGAIDVYDILAALDGFSGVFSEGCAVHNVDIAPCDTDGVIDIFDITAVLDAFSGIDACCEGEPKVLLASSAVGEFPEASDELSRNATATRVAVTTGIQSVKARAETTATGRWSVQGAKVVASETALAIVPRDNTVDAGGTVVVDVFADDVKDLRGYQLRLTGTDAESAAGAGGGNTAAANAAVVDVYVDTEREDYVFAGLDARHAEDMENHRMVAALLSGGTTRTGRVYLGTFIFKADDSAGSSPTPGGGGAPNASTPGAGGAPNAAGIHVAIHPLDGLILVDPTGAVLDIATPPAADVAID